MAAWTDSFVATPAEPTKVFWTAKGLDHVHTVAVGTGEGVTFGCSTFTYSDQIATGFAHGDYLPLLLFDVGCARRRTGITTGLGTKRETCVGGRRVDQFGTRGRDPAV